MEQFFKNIEHLNYVVQRNWENLPDSAVNGEHDDLDLFVSEEDREELEKWTQGLSNVDVRSERDKYYPTHIGIDLLSHRIKVRGFWTPGPKAHFLSLYYHNLVHKKDDPYRDKLKEIFLEAYPPVKCIDDGVGYYAEGRDAITG